MTNNELQYYHELLARLADEYDTTIVSFADYDLEDRANLIYEISTSPYPLVLCAFLEAGKFYSDDECTMFRDFTPPSEEEVNLLLDEYGTQIPDYINLICEVVSPIWKERGWKAIQRLRVSLNDMTCMYTNYTIMKIRKTTHGNGKLPIF